MDLKYMPININLKGRKCLVVGGGAIALRKLETLLNYDTEITVVAPKIDKRVEFYESKNMLSIKKREYESPEALDYAIVISASDNEEVNETVAADCRKVGVPVNVVDNPKLCDFIFPATFHRDCLSVSVSSDGQAPFLSGGIRAILEHSMFHEKRWTTIAQLASVFRNRVRKHHGDNTREKTQAFDRFLSTDWQAVLKEVPDEALSDYIDTLLEPPKDNPETDENADETKATE